MCICVRACVWHIYCVFCGFVYRSMLCGVWCASAGRGGGTSSWIALHVLHPQQSPTKHWLLPLSAGYLTSIN
ncbi:hypothetical protein BGW36DRAFT_19524 [Talaromyces proteolyticus]|uniref:Uncharacterized protein n=1 Tax=Talaromyces proteolyticus TaxID=1131652 RepID=A0AAD4Q6R2_9EURO|nr:uncharacterized protein BGW36DRAFT_19524 [Talaromyces proteolyticus]KAH8705913.1 hypothetical protein BGW36DRAFT_19524 [Talaromyces proteolyticus]